MSPLTTSVQYYTVGPNQRNKAKKKEGKEKDGVRGEGLTGGKKGIQIGKEETKLLCLCLQMT